MTLAEQLLAGDGDWSFTVGPSVADLQQRQGVHALVDPFTLADDDLTDAERDALLAYLSGR